MKITSTVSEITIEWEKDQPQASPRSLSALKAALSNVKEIQSVKFAGANQNRVVVVYSSSKGVVEFLRQVTNTLRSTQINPAEIREEIFEFEAQSSAGTQQQPRTVLGYLTRWTYGGLAIGSFVMAWVGLVVPGIPTVPFAILTVYFAEKFSPTLRNRLMESPVIGPAMRDWAEYHAIRRSVRDRVFLFVGVMVAITMMFTAVDSMAFLLVVLFAGLSLYMVYRIPVIDDAEAVRSPRLRIA